MRPKNIIVPHCPNLTLDMTYPELSRQTFGKLRHEAYDLGLIWCPQRHSPGVREGGGAHLDMRASKLRVLPEAPDDCSLSKGL